MQRPNKVTPTKIPSLGVIVRLVSFTGELRGFVREARDWRMVRNKIWLNPLACCYEAGRLLRRTTRRKSCLVSRRPGSCEGLIEMLNREAALASGSSTEEAPGFVTTR